MFLGILLLILAFMIIRSALAILDPGTSVSEHSDSRPVATCFPVNQFSTIYAAFLPSATHANSSLTSQT